MSANLRVLLFLVATMGTVFFLVPKDIIPVIGNFAIGWMLADISFMLFKD